MTVVAAVQPQDILIQPEMDKNGKDVTVTPVALIKNENIKEDPCVETGTSITTIPTNYIQTTTVQEYLQRMQNATLPVSLHQYLRFNNDVKREQVTDEGVIETIVEQGDICETQLIMNDMGEEVPTEENPDDPEKGIYLKYT